MITLQELSGYLPYGLKTVNEDEFGTEIDIITGIGLNDECIMFEKSPDFYLSWEENNTIFKPILRPISDLTKEIEVNGEKFVPIEKLKQNYIGETIGLNPATWSYRSIQKLFEWHFDVFGLIERGDAIDINTLK